MLLVIIVIIIIITITSTSTTIICRLKSRRDIEPKRRKFRSDFFTPFFRYMETSDLYSTSNRYVYLKDELKKKYSFDIASCEIIFFFHTDGSCDKCASCPTKQPDTSTSKVRLICDTNNF